MNKPKPNPGRGTVSRLQAKIAILEEELAVQRKLVRRWKARCKAKEDLIIDLLQRMQEK